MSNDDVLFALQARLSRRQLIVSSTSAGALAISGCGGGGADASTPDGGTLEAAAHAEGPTTSAIATAAASLPAASLPFVRLLSPTAGTAAFTLGQAFRRGDVPTGWSVAADVADFQAVVKNRWPDGSVKFALLSGRASLAANTWHTLRLRVAGAPSGVPVPVSLAELKATGISASISYGSYGTVSWAGSAWDTPWMTWVSGPQMSSWIYRKPIGADSHLVAWLEVRCYKGVGGVGSAVEVLPWIENGYLSVAAPGERLGLARFTLGGSTRFSQNVRLLNHTRAVLGSGGTLTHWLGTAPQVLFKHDTAYLRATRMVPNYRAATAATSPVLARLATSYTPLGQANYPLEMGSTGYDPSIGLLPEWDVAYLTSGGDARALRAVVIHGYCAGRYGIHYRDQATQRPLAFSAHPTRVMGEGSGVTDIGASSVGSYTPNASGGTPPQFKTSHHPSMGYLAYLLTGWHYFMEQTQFLATANYLKQTDTVRQGAKGVLQTATGTNQVRGAAWALRSLAQAAAITPDTDSLRSEFVNCIHANVSWYHARYVARPNNPQGLVEPYDDYSYGADPLESAPWQDDFFTAAFGYLRDIAPYSSTVAAQVQQFTEWKYKAIVGRLGGTGTHEFSYRRAAQYTVRYAPSDAANYATGTGPWYASWGAIARAMGMPTDGTAGASLLDGYFPEPTSYWGNLMPAISYAVDHAAPGALQAWNRMTGASNFSLVVPLFNDAPVWGVKPR